ncbi:hypothetical protein ACSJMR_10395 [Acinetobacter pecorum]|uniref:hypothetical protein n=1 Tax=Acinetobacter pecorum TaxID=2762215 RepID=UPI003EE4FB98
MSNYSFLEKYFFKKRYIFVYDLNNIGPISKSINIIDVRDVDKILKKNIKISPRLQMYISKRKNSSSWKLFLYLDNNEIQGYSFLHIPTSIEWNDSLPTNSNEARESSTFVEIEYRGLGIRGKILNAQKKFCKENNKKMWCVIEAVNISSIKSTNRSGVNFVGTNYLIKFLGKNIFSIVFNSFKVFLLVGKKRGSC